MPRREALQAPHGALAVSQRVHHDTAGAGVAERGVWAMPRHPGRAGGHLHIVVDEPRHEEDEPDHDPLTWPGDPQALPYLDSQGNLVLPMNAPTRYRWW